MRKAIKVTPSGEMTTLDLDAPEGAYQVLSTAVEGMIEPVGMAGDFEFYCNEEYRYQFEATERNYVAESFWNKYFPNHAGNQFLGNVIFTGGVDDEGETMGLNPERETELRTVGGLVVALYGQYL